MANAPVEVKKATPAPSGPPDMWRAFRTEMDRLFDRFTGGWGTPPLGSMFADRGVTVSSPAVDIGEDETGYRLTAELPGMDEKQIEVVLSGDTLTLQGEKRSEKEEKQANSYLSERSYGMFQRSFSLPENVDRDKIMANFANGVLTITIPKSAKAIAQQKKIEVKAAA